MFDDRLIEFKKEDSLNRTFFADMVADYLYKIVGGSHCLPADEQYSPKKR